eukprot:scaffold586487_cov17-Prasinocladus_malaysianus.AAC.1
MPGLLILTQPLQPVLLRNCAVGAMLNKACARFMPLLPKPPLSQSYVTGPSSARKTTDRISENFLRG